jgi:hypothetical protein
VERRSMAFRSLDGSVALGKILTPLYIDSIYTRNVDLLFFMWKRWVSFSFLVEESSRGALQKLFYEVLVSSSDVDGGRH